MNIEEDFSSDTSDEDYVPAGNAHYFYIYIVKFIIVHIC